MMIKKIHTRLLVVLLLVVALLFIGYEASITRDTWGPNIAESKPNPAINTTFIFPNYLDSRDWEATFREQVSGAKSYQYGGPTSPKSAQADSLSPHALNVYSSKANIFEKLDKCDKLGVTANVLISKPRNLDIDLTKVLTQCFSEEMLQQNSYYREVAPFFQHSLKQHLRDNTVTFYWFQLAGSSVWLEHYGVHLMIRRVIYSPTGHRNAPIISLTYGQVFDDNWNEMEDVALVIPDQFEEGAPLHLLHFPGFLNIPFFHDEDRQDKRYYGPEDPRITLIKNKQGHSEPVIIFNSFHRKYESRQVIDEMAALGKSEAAEIKEAEEQKKAAKAKEEEEKKEAEMKKEAKKPNEDAQKDENAKEAEAASADKQARQDSFVTKREDHEEYFDEESQTTLYETRYRSMWRCFPFQTQRGKANVEGKPNPQYDQNLYNKVDELRIKGRLRRAKQKNWTPFKSHLGVEGSSQHDTHLHFVYRWKDLEILKCDLFSGACEFDYRTDPKLKSYTKVGELRGGTELVSINELLSQLGADVKYYLPQDREVWLGFARAHLDRCGCGPVQYRPNMVIIVKDMIKGRNGVLEPVYKLSHVSSSISFDVKVLGWYLDLPDRVCGGNNILIPNGISTWTLGKAEGGDKTSESLWPDDTLTLTLSVGDLTVEKIEVKNLLGEVLRFGDVFQGNEDKVYVPNSIDSMLSVGYNNDNVACAMAASRKFCAAYGKEHQD